MTTKHFVEIKGGKVTGVLTAYRDDWATATISPGLIEISDPTSAGIGATYDAATGTFTAAENPPKKDTVEERLVRIETALGKLVAK